MEVSLRVISEVTTKETFLQQSVFLLLMGWREGKLHCKPLSFLCQRLFNFFVFQTFSQILNLKGKTFNFFDELKCFMISVPQPPFISFLLFLLFFPLQLLGNLRFCEVGRQSIKIRTSVSVKSKHKKGSRPQKCQMSYNWRHFPIHVSNKSRCVIFRERLPITNNRILRIPWWFHNCNNNSFTQRF